LSRAHGAKRESQAEEAAVYQHRAHRPFYSRAATVQTPAQPAPLRKLRGCLLRTTLALTAEGLRRRSQRGAICGFLRAMVHLRPAGGCRGLQVLGSGRAEVSAPDTAELLPSATVWRLVEQYNTPVALDVNFGRGSALGSSSGESRVSSLPRRGWPLPVGPPVESSRLRLLQRDTTRLLGHSASYLAFGGGGDGVAGGPCGGASSG
jgi:hypothetical protein